MWGGRTGADMKFRKKPVVIEARVWDGNYSTDNDPSWFTEARMAGKLRVPSMKEDCPMLIETLEGVMKADIGDWIIQGVKGEIYPCKTDIFEATYAPVGAGDEDSNLKESLKGLIWMFETMMEAANIDLDETEIRMRDIKTDEQLGEMMTLNQLLDKYRKEAE